VLVARFMSWCKNAAQQGIGAGERRSGARGSMPKTLDGRVMRWRHPPPGWTYLLTHQQVKELSSRVTSGRLHAETLGARRPWAPRLLGDLRNAGRIVALPVDGAWHYRLRLWAVREVEFVDQLDSAREAVRDRVNGYIEETESRVAVATQDLFQSIFFFRRREGRIEPTFSTKRLAREEAGRLDDESG
jgi:hypothetical protein